MVVRVLAISCSVLVALAIAGSVGAAADRGPSLRFRTAPAHALPGDQVSVRIAVRPAGVRCTLTVTYADGSRQAGLRALRATGGRAKWDWRVPEEAGAGNARLRAACRHAGTATRSLSIVGAIVPAKIEVEQTGFSIRPKKTSGATASYGLILKNTSPNQDALGLTVLVNFVDDTNFLWGSATSRVVGIPAGSRFALGDSLSFDGLPPVTRLEVTVQIGGRISSSKRPAALASMPGIANPRIFPDLREPQWVGGVDGELINDDPKLILERTHLSIVVFDAAGRILGGGNGTSSISLPPAARSVFKITSDMDAIPMLLASSTMISTEPSYSQPGS
jgi:hypothetical protein